MPLTPHSDEGRTKVQEVTTQLQTLASQMGPHAKLPTHRQLRHSMGVSITTLNSALSELESRHLIYRVQGSGIYVADTKRRSIALVCDPTYFQGASHSPFWDVLLEQARQWATAHDEVLSFHFATPQAPGPEQPGEVLLHDGLVHDIRAGRVHGVIAVGLPVRVAEWVRDQDVPLVAFAGWSDYTVGIDGVELIRLGVAELARQGCRRIGLWRTADLAQNFEATRADATANMEVFRQALEATGVPLYPALIQDNRQLLAADKPHAGVSKQEQGYQTVMEVFGRSRTKASAKPDGLVITDDMMTHGALVALQKLEIRVGRELKIATHANRGSMVLLGRDELTLLEIDPAEVVQALFEMLETLMSGKTPAQAVVSIKPKGK